MFVEKYKIKSLKNRKTKTSPIQTTFNRIGLNEFFYKETI